MSYVFPSTIEWPALLFSCIFPLSTLFSSKRNIYSVMDFIVSAVVLLGIFMYTLMLKRYQEFKEMA